MILKHGETHKHVLRQGYTKDKYENGTRYIKVWVCITKNCGFKEAYDLTHEEPKGVK